MIRKVSISLTPSAALTALATLHAPPGDLSAAHGASAATGTFGSRFGQEVARAFEAHARALDVLGQCLDWLERRGLATVTRPRMRQGQREATWRCPVQVRVDVRDLSRELVAEADDPDSKARASAWALRAVLRHAANTTLHAADVRAGSERGTAAEMLAAYDTAMASVGYGPHAAAPARLAHLASRRRRDEPAVAPAAPAAPKVTANAPPVKPAQAKTATPKAAAPKIAEPPRKPKAASTGFGGLPDDATSEDRKTGEVYGVRGLTLDAEFFLVEADIVEWPCDVKMLERGRRAVVSKLHPDRAGEASTSSFHRAVKGHAELLQKLGPTATAKPANAEAPAAPSEPAPSNAPETTRQYPKQRGGEADAPRPKPAGSAKPRRPRAPAAASEPAPPVTPAPVVSATSTTFEWPPRPPVVEAPRVIEAPPVVAAPPLVETPVVSATRSEVRGAGTREKKRRAAAKRTA